MGPNHALTRGSQAQGFCNSFLSKEEEQSRRRGALATWTGHGGQKPEISDRNGSYYNEATRASEFHDLLSCHHRPDGEGIHMPVGDISKVEG